MAVAVEPGEIEVGGGLAISVGVAGIGANTGIINCSPTKIRASAFRLFAAIIASTVELNCNANDETVSPG